MSNISRDVPEGTMGKKKWSVRSESGDCSGGTTISKDTEEYRRSVREDVQGNGDSDIRHVKGTFVLPYKYPVSGLDLILEERLSTYGRSRHSKI